jgi:molybdenum cofactor synthesis domain-containing protein
MKLIRTEDAVGQVLCHDMTQIIRGVTKDAVFRKGHIVRPEDIPVLLSIGKDHIYVWEKQEGMLHEDEAAEILCRMCIGDRENACFVRSGVKEGKIEILAGEDGLLKVNRKLLYQINSLGQMMIAARHGNLPVKKGDKLAGTRIIPLVIEEEKMLRAESLCGGEPILQLMPFKNKRVGILTTGNEVFYGRIEDTFTPVIEEKLSEYPARVIAHEILGDDHERITAAILHMIREEGADLVICTGGMSVDPDDRTPLAIKNTGAQIVSYGAPVLPGAMFLLAYFEGGIPVLGLPGCVMYAKRTIFDLVLPRIMADDPVTAMELAALGEGGLCLSCPVCTWPNCGFGKA